MIKNFIPAVLSQIIIFLANHCKPVVLLLFFFVCASMQLSSNNSINQNNLYNSSFLELHDNSLLKQNYSGCTSECEDFVFPFLNI